MKTVSTSKEDAQESRRWFVVDAKGQVLGRVASRIASILRGKHKVSYTPHIDTGDFVIVINAAEVVLTGRKEQRKMYHRHTGWVGGVVSKTAEEVREETPEQLIEHAVKGMLPKGNLRDSLFGKLKVYSGVEHPHAAQKPEVLSF